MQKICRESEASLDYYSLFKAIMKRVPVPMSPLESLASSAVRTAHKVTLLHPAVHAEVCPRMPYQLRLQLWLSSRLPPGACPEAMSEPCRVSIARTRL